MKTRTYHSKTKARNSVTITHKTTRSKSGATIRTNSISRVSNGHRTTISHSTRTPSRRRK